MGTGLAERKGESRLWGGRFFWRAWGFIFFRLALSTAPVSSRLTLRSSRSKPKPFPRQPKKSKNPPVAPKGPPAACARAHSAIQGTARPGAPVEKAKAPLVFTNNRTSSSMTGAFFHGCGRARTLQCRRSAQREGCDLFAALGDSRIFSSDAAEGVFPSDLTSRSGATEKPPLTTSGGKR